MFMQEYMYKISNLLLEVEFLREKQKLYNGVDPHINLVEHAIEKQIFMIEKQIITIGEKYAFERN